MKHRSLALLVLSACAASGCLSTPQREGVREFGEAASATSAFVAEQPKHMRDRLVEVNAALVVVKGLAIDRTDLKAWQIAAVDQAEEEAAAADHDDDRPLDRELNIRANRGVKLGKDPLPFRPDEKGAWNLDGPYDPESLGEVVAAAAALEAYAEALVAIVDYDSDAALASAGEKLSGSLKGVTIKSRQIFSDEKAEALGNLVAGLGGIFVESARYRALRTIVAAYRPVVPDLADVLRDILDPTVTNGSLAWALRGRADDLLLAANEAMSTPAEQAALGLGGRKICADAYVLALTTLRELENVQADAGGVLDQLKVAHSEMADLLSKRSLDRAQIVDFAKKVKALLDQLKVLT
jgi:hypothetical protein